MKIVSFINPPQRDVIDRILTHGGLSSRAPPAPACAPPQGTSPAFPELQYVSDPAFVDDAAPPEPVWSAD
jgi:hypothetical protein